MNGEDTRHDWRCMVTLLLDDVTEEEAGRFFYDGAEIEGTGTMEGLIAIMESPGEIERQP